MAEKINGKKLDSIEERQLRIENTINAINEQIEFLIDRGVFQTESRFQSDKQQLIVNPVGTIATA